MSDFELNALPEQIYTAGRVCMRCGEQKDFGHVCRDVKAAHNFAKDADDYLAALRQYQLRPVNGGETQ